MINVLLPIFFHTSNTSTLKDLDIDYDLSDCEVRDIIFFNIDAICEYCEENTNRKFTSIFAGGNEFICVLQQDKVLEKILISNLND